MIVVRVELWSAIDGSTTELARMVIDNVGCSPSGKIADYRVRTLRGRSKADLDRFTVQHTGRVYGHRRLALHVWHLVAKALKTVGYGGGQ